MAKDAQDQGISWKMIANSPSHLVILSGLANREDLDKKVHFRKAFMQACRTCEKFMDRCKIRRFGTPRNLLKQIPKLQILKKYVLDRSNV